MIRTTVAVLCLLISAYQDGLIAAENWPQWRGPLGTGVAVAGDYPVTFSKTESVAWTVTLPGFGTSTPAIWGNRVFVTCGIADSSGKKEASSGEKDMKRFDSVVCYDMSHKELWRQKFGPERRARN